MLIVTAVAASLILLLYPYARMKYGDYLSDVDEGRFRLKKLLPLGLFILDITGVKYTSNYSRKLTQALCEIHGMQHGPLWIRLHLAGKAVLLLGSFLFCIFVGALSRPDASYAVFCAVMAGCVFYLPDRELYNKVKKRRLEIQMDFPDFVNKLALLINAGLTLQKAWEKAALCTARETPLYRELHTAMLDIRAGKPEHRAYEEFAKRCRLPEITRFISVILQNIRKGSSELVPLLRVFSTECWEMRKNAAKRYGEEASVKMLFPMMLMLLAILLIVGMPAVLALRNMG